MTPYTVLALAMLAFYPGPRSASVAARYDNHYLRSIFEQCTQHSAKIEGACFNRYAARYWAALLRESGGMQSAGQKRAAYDELFEAVVYAKFAERCGHDTKPYDFYLGDELAETEQCWAAAWPCLRAGRGAPGCGAFYAQPAIRTALDG